MEKKVLPLIKVSQKVSLKFLWTSPKTRQWAHQGFKFSQKFSVFGAGYRIGSHLTTMLLSKRKHPKLIKEILKDSTLATTVGCLFKTMTSAISRTSFGEALLSLVNTSLHSLTHTSFMTTCLRTLTQTSFVASLLRSSTTLTELFKTNSELFGFSALSKSLLNTAALPSSLIHFPVHSFLTVLGNSLLALGSFVLMALLTTLPMIGLGILLGSLVCLFKKNQLKKALI